MGRRICAAAWLSLLACAVAGTAAADPLITLETGDIIVLDVTDDAVYHFDPGTGVVTTLATGPWVASPRGVALSPEGQLFVTDSFNDWMVRIDPFTGEIRFVTYFSADTFPDPGAAVSDASSNWDVLAIEGETQTIYRVDPVLGAIFPEFHLFENTLPLGLARDPIDQTLVVSDQFTNSPSKKAGVHRVDVPNNLQKSVSLDDGYRSLRRVAVQGDGQILVTDRGVGGNGAAVYQIDPTTGAYGVFGAFGASFTGPQGIAVDDNNTTLDLTDDTVLVADFSKGRLYRLGADGDTRTELSRAFHGPYDVLVVPELVPRTHPEFLISEADPGGPMGDPPPTGDVYAADSDADARSPVAGGAFTEPVAMAYSTPTDDIDNGTIYVIDGPSTLVSRDLGDGTEDVIADGEPPTNLTEISDIAVEFDGKIVVTDYADGEIIRIDPVTGDETVVTGPGELGKPTSILVDTNGNLLVTCEDILDDDGDPTNDSGLYRVNPRNGDTEQYLIITAGTGEPFQFLDPRSLTRDWNGDVLLIDHRGLDPANGNPLTRIFRVIGASGSYAQGTTFAIDTTAINDVLDTAVSMTVDADRTIVVAFETLEPIRIDPLSAVVTALPIMGDLNFATDLLLEGTPPPGDPTDTDADGIPDGSDNCPKESNSDQEDIDSDGAGDPCQLFDIDRDGWSDADDNCPDLWNPATEGRCAAGLMNHELCTTHSQCDLGETKGVCLFAQIDFDVDGHGDVCDNCPGVFNDFQEDFNSDGIGDACQDSDGDTKRDFEDTCKEIPNFVGPACSAGKLGIACVVDSECDIDPDDGLGVCSPMGGGGTCYLGKVAPAFPDFPCSVDDDCDNGATQGACSVANDDFDNDGHGEVCDNCPGARNGNFNPFNPTQSDLNNDGFGDVCQNLLAGPDTDGDGIPNDGGAFTCPDRVTIACDDNCPSIANPDQRDRNADGIGDVCQPSDSDEDGWPNSQDNCPNHLNPEQEDTNADGYGDACQDDDGPVPDTDGDGIPEGDGSNPCTNGNTVGCDDNCPAQFNTNQSDLNGDGQGDACQDNDLDNDGIPDADDNCPNVPNPGQGDLNGDAIPGVGNGDFCQEDDADFDGIPEGDGTYPPCASGRTVGCDDNCPYYGNADQRDFDGDGVGDFCDNSDGDVLTDAIDNCPLVTNLDQADTTDGDGAGDACDNCLDVPNAILQGTCTAGLVGTLCGPDSPLNACGPNGFCSLDQEDGDLDDIGDACETGSDFDDDGLTNPADNCPFGPNAAAQGTCTLGLVGDTCLANAECVTGASDGFCSLDQEDHDFDGVGDVCETGPDADGDGLNDRDDNCPLHPNAAAQGSCMTGRLGELCQAHAACDDGAVIGFCSLAQEDTDNDGNGDVCDPTPTAIPEPTGTLMLLSGLGLLRMLHRRRERSSERLAA